MDSSKAYRNTRKAIAIQALKRGYGLVGGRKKKKLSKWNIFFGKYRKSYPDMSMKQIAREYKKTKGGMAQAVGIKRKPKRKRGGVTRGVGRKRKPGRPRKVGRPKKKRGGMVNGVGRKRKPKRPRKKQGGQCHWGDYIDQVKHYVPKGGRRNKKVKKKRKLSEWNKFVSKMKRSDPSLTFGEIADIYHQR